MRTFGEKIVKGTLSSAAIVSLLIGSAEGPNGEPGWNTLVGIIGFTAISIIGIIADIKGWITINENNEA